jgi:hypothetical protein
LQIASQPYAEQKAQDANPPLFQFLFHENKL